MVALFLDIEGAFNNVIISSTNHKLDGNYKFKEGTPQEVVLSGLVVVSKILSKFNDKAPNNFLWKISFHNKRTNVAGTELSIKMC